MSAPEPIPFRTFSEMIREAGRIQRHRKATLSVGFAVLYLVTVALPWAETAVDDWAAHEEAKAAQAWRRSP